MPKRSTVNNYTPNQLQQHREKEKERMRMSRQVFNDNKRRLEEEPESFSPEERAMVEEAIRMDEDQKAKRRQQMNSQRANLSPASLVKKQEMERVRKQQERANKKKTTEGSVAPETQGLTPASSSAGPRRKRSRSRSRSRSPDRLNKTMSAKRRYKRNPHEVQRDQLRSDLKSQHARRCQEEDFEFLPAEVSMSAFTSYENVDANVTSRHLGITSAIKAKADARKAEAEARKMEAYARAQEANKANVEDEAEMSILKDLADDLPGYEIRAKNQVYHTALSTAKKPPAKSLDHSIEPGRLWNNDSHYRMEEAFEKSADDDCEESVDEQCREFQTPLRDATDSCNTDDLYGCDLSPIQEAMTPLFTASELSGDPVLGVDATESGAMDATESECELATESEVELSPPATESERERERAPPAMDTLENKPEATETELAPPAMDAIESEQKLSSPPVTESERESERESESESARESEATESKRERESETTKTETEPSPPTRAKKALSVETKDLIQNEPVSEREPSQAWTIMCPTTPLMNVLKPDEGPSRRTRSQMKKKAEFLTTKPPKSSKKQPVSFNIQPASSKKPRASSNKELVSTNEEPVAEPASSKKPRASSNKELVSTNKEPASEAESAVVEPPKSAMKPPKTPDQRRFEVALSKHKSDAQFKQACQFAGLSPCPANGFLDN